MNEELKKKVISKIKDGTFGINDLKEFIELEVEVCNESEEIQEEVEGFNCVYQFVVENGQSAWIKIENGKFTAGEGTYEKPDVTLTMNADIAVGIYTGSKDATNAYMQGELKITGPLPNAVKFRTITEILREILELD